MTSLDKFTKPLTTTELAKFLNVHVNTIRRWSNSSILKCVRIGPRKDRRFTKEDIERFLVSSARK